MPSDMLAVRRVLADAFASDPWAHHVLGAPGSQRPRALAAVMRMPVFLAQRRGGLLIRNDDSGRVGAVSTWVPARDRAIRTADVVRARALGVPFTAGVSTMGRLTRDQRDIDAVLEEHLRSSDAYLWVLGARRDLHGRGLGRAVVEATCNDARRRGFDRVVLNTDNPANVAMYERLGFQLLGTAPRPSALTVHVLAREVIVR
ncbi:MAG: GNAT family N-acetyltransferase [Nocardioides sp.]